MLNFYSLFEYHRRRLWTLEKENPYCKIFLSPFDPVGLELVARLSRHDIFEFQIILLPVSVDPKENEQWMAAVGKICDTIGND